jgi:hypothetical protein
MPRVHLLATPAALWKAGHESNPGTPPGASGSQSNSTKPKNNLRPAPRDGMALVPLTDAPASLELPLDCPCRDWLGRKRGRRLGHAIVGSRERAQREQCNSG